MAQAICPNIVDACGGEFTGVCTLPASHAGECEFMDAMGLCGENENCRAQADWHRSCADKRDRDRPHNH